VVQLQKDFLVFARRGFLGRSGGDTAKDDSGEGTSLIDMGQSCHTAEDAQWPSPGYPLSNLLHRLLSLPFARPGP
jgi:hypothetical protein